MVVLAAILSAGVFVDAPIDRWSMPMMRQLCVSRNDLEEGFEAAVQSFEAWCRLLLLDGVQRAGLFRQPGQSAALEDIVRLNRRPGAGHARMVQACLDILTSAGFLRHFSCCPLHIGKPVHHTIFSTFLGDWCPALCKGGCDEQEGGWCLVDSH